MNKKLRQAKELLLLISCLPDFDLDWVENEDDLKSLNKQQVDKLNHIHRLHKECLLIAADFADNGVQDKHLKRLREIKHEFIHHPDFHSL